MGTKTSEVYPASSAVAGVIEQLNRKMRRRIRVVGTFPDRNFALMPNSATWRVSSGVSKSMVNMTYLKTVLTNTYNGRLASFSRSLQTFLQIYLDCTLLELPVPQ